MDLIQKVKSGLSNRLTTFRLFERIIAAVCVAIPLLLMLWDSCHPGFRHSISDYAYMCDSYIFGMLLCMAAMLFIFNGAVYFRSRDKLQVSIHGTWYNAVLGICLLGVIIFPTKQFPNTHIVFAAIFYVGNALIIAIFHHKKNRVVSIILGILTLVSFIPTLAWKVDIIWPEWFSLAVIGVHLILESLSTKYSSELVGVHQNSSEMELTSL